MQHVLRYRGAVRGGVEGGNDWAVWDDWFGSSSRRFFIGFVARRETVSGVQQEDCPLKMDYSSG